MNFVRIGNVELRADKIVAVDYTPYLRHGKPFPKAWITFTGTFAEDDGIVLIDKQVGAFKEWWQNQRNLIIIA